MFYDQQQHLLAQKFSFLCIQVFVPQNQAYLVSLPCASSMKRQCCLSDINELKVFVDLASISAGESDMDVDRVACFHDAVLGYSSMLYELKPDSDFRVFQEIVKKLWRALENDPNLPKKLVR